MVGGVADVLGGFQLVLQCCILGARWYLVAANYTSEQSGIAQAGKYQRFSCLFKRIAQADAQGPLLK